MEKITRIGPQGIELIKRFEGFKARPYLCPAGIPTIGYGSTYYPDGRKVTMKDPPITVKEAESLLLENVKSYEKCVSLYVRKDIRQHQFDALVSFTYNLGCRNLQISTLLKKLNVDPDDPSIEREFLKWTKSKGKVLYGLVLRRQAEASLYFLKSFKTMARPRKSKSTRGKTKFTFDVSKDWIPTKGHVNSDFMESVLETASKLLSKESFPITMFMLKQEAGYKDAHSACSSIRAALMKKIGKDRVGAYGMHVVKDANGKEVAIRIRKK